MKKDLIRKIDSSFLNCEKDTEVILRKLFIETRPYSDILKRLLVINNPDCIDDFENSKYKEIINNMSLDNLIKEEYIRFTPKTKLEEFPEIKTFIIFTFDNFIPNDTNPKFRNNTINFDIVCHNDYFYLGNFRLRPLKIVGYIDGILDECKLTGIGTTKFAGCNEIVLNEDFTCYTLTYEVVHGSDDIVPFEGE